MSSERFVDLHMHSTFSDGKLSPAELVATARRKELAAVALTDHDCLDGFDALRSAAEGSGVEVLCGVELSCEFRGRDLHILGYGVSPAHEGLQGMLRRFRDTRERRGELIVEKLAGLGVRLDMDDVRRRAGHGALGRPHIAEALVAGGHVADFAEAFARYIGEDGPAYVEKYKMSPDDAVRHIRDAGGLAFVAHPGSCLETPREFEDLLALGFDGIEVLHPHHDASARERLASIAAERGLMVSGGSDFHGFEGRDNMGEPPVPWSLYAAIRDRLAALG